MTKKLYLFGKYSTQTMIFWFLCAFIWFRNMKKMLLQMTSVSLQPVPSLDVNYQNVKKYLLFLLTVRMSNAKSKVIFQKMENVVKRL
jgi:hypothetical protein